MLYEGYVLYPYRASAPKNQVRWQFGVLVPASVNAASDASERSSMQTECLVDLGRAAGSVGTRVWVRVRFLQAQQRLIRGRRPGNPTFLFLPPDLEVDGGCMSTGTKPSSG